MSVRKTRAKEIFLQALEDHTPSEWPAFLAQACENDFQLRQRVEALLEVHGEPNQVLDDLPRLSAPFSEGPGTVIGPYKLLEEIGEGGFGIVYLAEQSEPIRRRVALKIIKPGMDTKQVIARFKAERQALALMDHPNIAKVLDAGRTDSGRPYFVMQLVSGVPISEYCDRCNLGTRERLALFMSVCHAIQHAHQKGIIHRDIKPTNVLITMRDGRPEPQVIDFGVAKAINQRLTEQTLVTGFAQMLGTPLYMSPEQAELRPLELDTRTDIYSLGVLLYELLTGTTPFEREAMNGASYEEICRILREEEPPKPSVRISTLAAEARTTVSAHRCTDPQQLKQIIRGDLDWICMKALEKDRTRRYDTANGLAMDIDRFLNEEPVLACPPSAGYRLRKFARRNRVLITTLLMLASVLLLAAILSTWLAVLESLSRRTAERERASTIKQRDRAVRAEKQLDATVYAQKIALAHHELQAGHVDRARELLALCDSEDRHWEWHYLQRLCNPELVSIQSWRPYMFSSVAFSPDGERIAASVGYWRKLGAAVNIYDARTGRRIGRLPPHRGWRIEDVAFSDDGRRIASISGFYDKNHDLARPGEVKVWDVIQQKNLLEVEGSIHSVAFSADGNRVAWVTQDNSIIFWDLESARRLFEIPAMSVVHSIQLSVDARWLAAGCEDSTVKIWDVKSRRLVQTLVGHTGPVLCICFDSRGHRLASGSEDSTARVWEVASGRPLATFAGHSGAVNSIRFSPDDKRVASAGGKRHLVWSWDAETGDNAVAFRGHDATTSDLDYSRDGSRLVACSSSLVTVWDTRRSTDFGALAQHGWWINAVAISPDGALVASGGNDGTAKVCDVATGELVSEFTAHGGNVRSLLFTRDGNHVVSSGSEGTVRIWDPRKGKEVRCFEAHLGNSVKGLALSSNGSYLASGDDSGTVIIWEWATGKERLRLNTQGYQIWSIDFSPDGEFLATAGADGTPRMWSAKTGRLIRTFDHHAGTLRCVKFSADGRLYAANDSDRAIRVWDVETGAQIHVLKHGAEVFGFALSPDGRRLLAACSQGVLRVWDTMSFEDLLRLPGSSENYHYVTFSSDGTLVAAGGDDRRVKLWDGSPVANDRIMRPLAREIVVGLYAGLHFRQGVIEELLRDSALDDDMRRLALDVAQQIEEDPTSLNQYSWYVARRRGGTAEGYRLAARQAEQACRLSSDNWAYMNTKGVAYYRLGKYRLAIDTLDQAVRANPYGGSAFDWFFLSMCWCKQGDAAKARQFFDDAVRWWRCRRTLDAIEEQELIMFWNEAVDLLGIDLDEDSFNPQRSLALRMHARHAVEHEKWQQAAKEFSRALEIGWPSQSLWASLACAQLLGQDAEGYQALCRQLWNEWRDAEAPTREQIALVCKLGANAVDDLDQLVLMVEELSAANPQSARLRNHFAGALYRAGRYDEALEQLKKNQRVRDSVFDWVLLSMVFAKLDSIDVAEMWLEKVQQLDEFPNSLELRVLADEAERLVRRKRPEHDAGTETSS